VGLSGIALRKLRWLPVRRRRGTRKSLFEPGILVCFKYFSGRVAFARGKHTQFLAMPLQPLIFLVTFFIKKKSDKDPLSETDLKNN
jgi:hypothetical protein